MMSTATVTLTTPVSFDSEANARAASRFVNEIVKGSSARVDDKSLIVESDSMSSKNEAIELLIGLGGQIVNN